jgi:2,4-dienoyl-CoA reductase-like NADH-dependent reductase (Old Yellow Enzyme family)
MHEAALLPLVIDDVERVDDRLHAGIRTPKSKTKTEDKAEAERAGARLGDAGYLLAHDIDAGRADAVSWGRDFISNPDLPERFSIGAEIAPNVDVPRSWYGQVLQCSLVCPP